MLRARAVGALVLPFGFVVGHLVGRMVAAGHDHGLEHRALRSLGQLSVPLLLLSVGLAALMGARGARLRLSGRSLAPAMIGMYLSVELYEHVGHGTSVAGSLVDRVLWIGLVAQVILAFALARLLRRANDLGANFRSIAARSEPAGSVPPWRPHDDGVVVAFAASTIPVRGPPIATRLLGR